MELGLVCLPLFLLLASSTSDVVLAGDPDITSDFILPSNATAVDGSFFTFTGLRKLVAAGPAKEFTVTKASLAEFPALNGQSVSLAVLSFPAGSVNAPHTHPRASELLFLLKGELEVGVVDTANKLYTQTLLPGRGTCLCFQRDSFTSSSATARRILRLPFLLLEAPTPALFLFLRLSSPAASTRVSWPSRSRLMSPPSRRLKLVSRRT